MVTEFDLENLSSGRFANRAAGSAGPARRYDGYVLRRVAGTVRRYGMFVPGSRVGVAVSGGADSVCLLHLLKELAPEWDLHLTVLHLNHLLRGEESDGDERFVCELASVSGLPFESTRVDVAGLVARSGGNLEQAARGARREFFLDLLRRGVLDRIALGHTRSDQAETVLFRFLRGAGMAGLAGMRPVTPAGLIRPLLEVTRAEVLEYLTAEGLRWREDASNLDLAFARNRIRHVLLPELVRNWNPALIETLAGMAAVAADEERYWAMEVERLAQGRLVERGGAVIVPADWLAGLPRAVARRVVRHAVAKAKGDLRGIDAPHIEQILELTRSLEGSGRTQAPGVDVIRSFDWLRLAPLAEVRPGRDYEIPVTAPARVNLPAGGVLSLELTEKYEETRSAASGSIVYNRGGFELDRARIPGSLSVRNWRPGDQYRPAGHTRDIKIKLLFQTARIPLWERRIWPILTCEGVIVWAASFGPAAEYAATESSPVILKVRKLEF